MDAASISSYAELERYYWWFSGRRRVIARLADRYLSDRPRRIIDWGCGPGGNFATMERYGDVLGVDASDTSIDYCRERGIHNVVKAETLADLTDNRPCDLFTNFDVLEHIPDDIGFLKEVYDRLVPGGHMLVTVPAHPFLWSQLDDILGHVRRYTRGELVEKFRRTGFTVVRASYFIALLSPAFVLARCVQRRDERRTTLNDMVVPLPRPINTLLLGTLYLEAEWIRWCSLPFGTSLILLAQKPEG